MQLQFGENLKQLRKEKQLTQEKIADVFGVSCQSVSRWELNICYPDVELLPAIANYFGVTIDQLLSNDASSKEIDRSRFFEELGKMDACGEDTVYFIQDFCRKYPDNPEYKWHLVRVASNCVLWGEGDSNRVYPMLEKGVEELIETKYRDAAIERMIDACREEDLEDWLAYAPYHATYNRRGCLVSRYNSRSGCDQAMYMHQGLENLEKFAIQLDRRFPDAFGPEKKGAYQARILRVIETFGDGTQPPDGWKLFYAYKQLVLAACLFATGQTEDGWRHFHSAIKKYQYVFALKDTWLDLGGELFSDLKVNKTWTAAIDAQGNEYELFGIESQSFSQLFVLQHLLTNPRWAWFDSVRDTPAYRAAVEWVQSIKENEST